MSKSTKTRATFASLIVFCLLSLIFVSVVLPRSDISALANKQQPTPAQNSNGSKHQGRPFSDIEDPRASLPTVDYETEEPTDPREKIKRRNKGKRFDNFGAFTREPTQNSGILVSEWDLNLPALPVAQSNAVVIGQTLKRGAFLSNDKSGVYTELSVRVKDVLKPNGSVAPNGIIDIIRVGGIVRYRTSDESFFAIKGQNMPQSGKRYLLFLKAIKESEISR